MKKLFCILFALSFLMLASCEKPNRKAEFVRGTVSNNVYESGVADLKFAPGPAWEFWGDDDIAQLNGIDPASVSDEKELADALNKVVTVYDMTAEDAHAGVSVAVIYENMTLSMGGKDITGDEYIKKLKDEIASKYETYNVSVSDGNGAVLGGLECRCVVASLEIESAKVVQNYYIAEAGDFYVSVTVTAGENTDIENDILPLFSSENG